MLRERGGGEVRRRMGGRREGRTRNGEEGGIHVGMQESKRRGRRGQKAGEDGGRGGKGRGKDTTTRGTVTVQDHNWRRFQAIITVQHDEASTMVSRVNINAHYKML